MLLGISAHFGLKTILQNLSIVYKKNKKILAPKALSSKSLNYIKYSCIILCAKMSGYSKIVYRLQGESKRFRVKDFELKQVLMCHKMFQFPQIIFTTNTHSKNFYCFPTLSVKIGFIPFLSSSDNHQSNHPVKCDATGISFFLISFLNAFHFSKLIR